MKKQNNICIVCKKEVLEEQPKYMIALEKPYINLYVHRECKNLVTLEFLQENLLEYIKNTN